MDFELVKKIACRLQAISNFAYDIHYNARGNDFYENHLFAERIGDQYQTSAFKDEIFETCFLGRGQEVPSSKEIEDGVLALTPESSKNEEQDYKKLRGMIFACLVDIESLTGLSLGEGDVFGRIASVLQRHNGLLFARLSYTEDEIVENSQEQEDAWKYLMNSKIEWRTTKTGAKFILKDGETEGQAIERIKKEKEENKKSFKENLYPKEINGKTKGKEKNPKEIGKTNATDNNENCALCSFAFELQTRGYDVKAKEGNEYTSAELKEMFYDENGDRLKTEVEINNQKEAQSFLNSIKENERYLLNFYHLDSLGGEGHVVNVYKNGNRVEISDGQIGKKYDVSYLSRIDYENRHKPEIYRIDNKAVNPKYFEFLE